MLNEMRGLLDPFLIQFAANGRAVWLRPGFSAAVRMLNEMRGRLDPLFSTICCQWKGGAAAPLLLCCSVRAE